MGVEAMNEVTPTSADIFKGASTVAGSVVGGGNEVPAGYAPSATGTMVSATPSKKYGSRAKQVKEVVRYHPHRLPALDMQNEIYLLRSAEAAAIRDGIDFTANAKALIATLQASKTNIRIAWNVWNPQRSMQAYLMARILAGEITLQVR